MVTAFVSNFVTGIIVNTAFDLSQKSIKYKINSIKMKRIFLGALRETVIKSIEQKQSVSFVDKIVINMAFNEVFRNKTIYSNFEAYKSDIGFRINSILAKVDITLANGQLNEQDIQNFKDKLSEKLRQAFPTQHHYLIDKETNENTKEIKQDVKEIKEDIKEIKETYKINKAQEVVTSQKDLTTMPPKPVNIIGRDTELSDLKSLLDTNQEVLLLNGMGGIGKTELCKKFFWTHYNDYDHIGWIECTSSLMESVISQIEGSSIYNIEDTQAVKYQKILSYLRAHKGNSLLVIDDMKEDDEEAFKELNTIPIKLLVSSRSIFKSIKKKYDLGVLDTDDCIELFYKHYTSTHDDKNVIEIINPAGHHTLTVELLAKTAMNACMSIAELYKILTDKGFDIGAVVKESVNTSWHNEKDKKKFFEHLIKVFDISEITEEEKYILLNIAIMPSEYINKNDIKKWIVLESNDSINTLVNKGWIKQEAKGFKVIMHQIIQETVRYQTDPDVDKCRLLVWSMANELHCNPEENPLDKAKYAEIAVYITMHIYNYDKDIARLLNNLSMIYKDMGEMEKALEYQVKAVEIVEKVLDKNHPDRASSYNNLSMIYKDMGEMEKALEYQLKAVEIREKVLDKNHPDRAQSYNNLSMIYQDMGEMEKAQEYQLKAVEIIEKVLDKNHPDIAISYNNLSSIYQDMGEMEKALEYQVKAVEIREKVLDKNHPSIATSYNNLSSIYKDMGEMEKAMEYQLKAVEIIEKVLDKNHPGRASSYNNLSSIYKDMGEMEKAMEYQLKAVEIIEKVLDKNHPSIATSYNNLSIIYKDMGEMQKALEYQLKTLEIEEKVLDKNHPDRASSYNNLSMIYKDMGEMEKALEYQLKTLEIKEKVLDKNHPDRAGSYNNLSLIYQDMGEMEKALEYQVKAVDIIEKVLDKNHPNIATSYNNLSLIYQDMGEMEKAQEYQLKAVEIREKVLDKNHPDRAGSYNNLSMIYQAMGDVEKALEYQLKAVEIMKTKFPKGHPNLDIMLKNLHYLQNKINS